MEEPSEQKPEAPPKQQQQQQVCNFVKRTNRNKNMRKREKPEEEEEDEESSVVQKSKAQKKPDNSLHFSTSREKAPEREAFYFESSKEIQVESDSRATATLETETDFSKDARAIRERQLKQAEQDLKSQDSSENLYKGMNQYKDHLAGFRREHTVAGEKAGGAHGPLRASAHIRTSVRFDYQPDICKDYKETGYCGYGDSCKFMHDRGDYKSGWQLERDWQESQKMKRDALVRGGRGGEDSDDGDSDDEELPFACFICREPFEEPVITKCKHYFCQHCALKHYARNKNCFVCNKPTNGVFNTAHEILRKMGQDKAASKKKN